MTGKSASNETARGIASAAARLPPQTFFVVSALFHYLGPAFAVLLFAAIPPLGVAWLRITSAAMVFAIWRRPRRFWTELSSHERWIIGGLAASLAAMNACFYLAIAKLPLATVGAIEFLGPISLAAAGARGARNLGALALAIGGVAFLTTVRLDGEPIGFAFAFANCGLFMLYIVLGHRIAGSGGVSGIDRLALSMLFASFLSAPFGFAEAAPAFSNLKLLGAAVVVGITSSVIPYVTDQVAMARLPRSSFALMLSLLPATATAIGLLVLGQMPTVADLAGIGLVIVAIAMHRPARDRSVSITDLYPPTAVRETFMLDVGDGHALYVALAGSPAGKPVIVLHGGPGSKCVPEYPRFFDPAEYNVVLVDQRGAGRSRPSGSVVANTTAHLVADLERVRERLAIERWMLFGGSWGSTLALAYAAAHPERVAAIVLRGVWLAREQDVRWLIEGLPRIVPDRYAALVEAVRAEDSRDLMYAFAEILANGSPSEQLAAATAWNRYEQECATLLPTGHTSRSEEETIALARIELHYFRNQCFLDSEALLEGVTGLGALPAVLVHGRYDLLAPLDGAFALARAWPGAELEIVSDAGHSMLEPSIVARLVAATDRIARAHHWS